MRVCVRRLVSVLIAAGLALTMSACANRNLESEVDRLQASVTKLQQDVQVERQKADAAAKAAAEAQQQAQIAAKAATSAAERADRVYQKYLERR